MVGRTIQHYEILEELGRGGMGVVYKARDVRLNRFVAIKLLSPQKLADPDRRQRFIQEARAVSALNHPNIVTVYEINRHEDADFIAMEFVAGRTLEGVVSGRPLPLSDILSYSVQIASALAAAHAAAIVHRDLKPGNVMVTADGRVKVLDFGLAKLGAPVIDETQDTLTFLIPDRFITSEGFVVGTAAYMSPEQAEGRRVDARSDIFSFGALLYEMATGRRAFEGDSAAGIMAAVLRDDPEPVRKAASGLPAELERIIHRCLRKDPARRPQHVDDILLDLEELKQQYDSGWIRSASVSSAILRRFRQAAPRWPSALAIALAAGVGGWLAASLFSPRPSEELAAELLLTRLSGAGGEEARSPQWSPDGRWVVFSSDSEGSWDIWKQPAGGGEAIRLTGPPQNERAPAWSPDGRTIAFSSDAGDGGILLIPESGGSSTRLTSFGAGPAFSPDGRLVAFHQNGDIYVIPANGGEPRAVVTGTSGAPHVVWSPDSRRILYWDRTQTDLFVALVENPEPERLHLVPLGDEVGGLSWSADGRWLVYARGPFGGNKDLWRVRLDPETGRPRETPRRLTLSAADAGDCAFSPDGAQVAYAVRRVERHLWRLDRDPATGLTTGLGSRLTREGQLNYYPAVSPDGELLVWTSHASGRGQLYYRRLAEGRARKLTRDWQSSVREVGAAIVPNGAVAFSSTLEGSFQLWRLASPESVSLRLTDVEQPAKDSLPAASPDGRMLAFYSNRAGNWDIWSLLLDPPAAPRQLTDWPGNEIYPAFSADARTIAFVADKSGTPDIWMMGAAGENARAFLEHPAEEAWPAWSPDGRFLYFSSNRGGEFHIWVAPAEGGEPRRVATRPGPAQHLPEAALYTKIAVTADSLIVPLETRRSDLYLLGLQ